MYGKRMRRMLVVPWSTQTFAPTRRASYNAGRWETSGTRNPRKVSLIIDARTVGNSVTPSAV